MMRQTGTRRLTNRPRGRIRDLHVGRCVVTLQGNSRGAVSAMVGGSGLAGSLISAPTGSGRHRMKLCAVMIRTQARSAQLGSKNGSSTKSLPDRCTLLCSKGRERADARLTPIDGDDLRRRRWQCARQHCQACCHARHPACALPSIWTKRTARSFSSTPAGWGWRASCRNGAIRRIPLADRGIGSKARTRTRRP
jgi:hypothetical protein